MNNSLRRKCQVDSRPAREDSLRRGVGAGNILKDRSGRRKGSGLRGYYVTGVMDDPVSQEEYVYVLLLVDNQVGTLPGAEVCQASGQVCQLDDSLFSTGVAFPGKERIASQVNLDSRFVAAFFRAGDSLRRAQGLADLGGIPDLVAEVGFSPVQVGKVEAY
mgnify:CR=1 FL=1